MDLHPDRPPAVPELPRHPWHHARRYAAMGLQGLVRHRGWKPPQYLHQLWHDLALSLHICRHTRVWRSFRDRRRTLHWWYRDLLDILPLLLLGLQETWVSRGNLVSSQFHRCRNERGI